MDIKSRLERYLDPEYNGKPGSYVGIFVSAALLHDEIHTLIEEVVGELEDLPRLKRLLNEADYFCEFKVGESEELDVRVGLLASNTVTRKDDQPACKLLHDRMLANPHENGVICMILVDGVRHESELKVKLFKLFGYKIHVNDCAKTSIRSKRKSTLPLPFKLKFRFKE